MPQTSQQWRDRIDRAIADDGLIFYCQPIFKPDAEEPSFIEVLVRLREDSGEVIPAAQFISVATPEQLKAIDRQAVLSTLRHLSKNDVTHAINLSGHTLNDLTFPAWLQRELERNANSYRRLAVEITEDVALSMPSTQVLAALRDMQVKLSQDDFGQGYATVAALLAIQPDHLKVAGEIVRLMHTDHWRECVVFGAMAIAYRRDMPIILEHVDCGEIIERALTLARHFPGLQLYLQGYKLGKPIPCLTGEDAPC